MFKLKTYIREKAIPKDQIIVIHVNFTRTNIRITLTDFFGRVILNKTAGSELDFDVRSRRSFPASNHYGIWISKQFPKIGKKRILIFKFKGFNFAIKKGTSRVAFLRGFFSNKATRKLLLQYKTTVVLSEATPVAHNGCRFRKRRR